MSVKDVFLDLVSYPTASDETTGTTPSTPGQKVLGAHIVEHMKEVRNGTQSPGCLVRALR